MELYCQCHRRATGFTASGTTNISDVVNMPNGSTITYTVVVTIPSSFTGDLVNTASVAPPAGVTDPNNTNDSQTDTDTQNSVADLSITKTDGTTQYTPGTTTTYTVVVTNNGPSNVTGATITDNIPVGTTWSYTALATGGATGFTASGTTNISDVVNMPNGSTITYTVVVTIPSSFTGNLVNTASVAPPAGVTDPDNTNDSQTDTDTQNSVADLSITKTDGSATYTPGTTTTYTVVVTNNGPSNVTGATVTDNIPVGTTWSYTALATGGATGFTASGTTNISDVVNMPNGSTITYTVVVTIPSSFTGNLVNTASVAPPAGVTDPDNTNDSQTDTDTQNSVADLSITKTDGSATYTPGTTTTYTVVVTNNGPSNVTGATVTDNIPVGTTWSYTALATGGATGFTASGTTNISDVVNMPNGSTITYTVVVTIPSSFTGNLVNTASVAPPTTDRATR
jgi:uncharacterized repeat protein (TIGR01451 family)